MTKPRLVKDDGGYAAENAWRSELIVSSRGKLVECYQNVAVFLRRHPTWRDVLGFDEFGDALIIRRPPAGVEGFPAGSWEEIHTLRLGMWLAQAEKFPVKSPDHLYRALVLAARERAFHPVREWLESIPWDGKQRLDTWLMELAGVEGCRSLAREAAARYIARVGRYFLVAMVARVYQPGCIMRSVPILEGAQERGKSTLLRELAHPWFSDTPILIGDPDAYLALKGKWLMEIAELQSFTRAEATWVKAFISSPEDHYRAPYERKVTDHKRQIVFVATTNEWQYLKDPSGHSRFWPLLSTGTIEVSKVAEVREQLFAEALAAYRAGERRYPDRQEQVDLFEPEQQAREIEDPWKTKVHRYLREQAGSRVTMEELMKAVGIEVEKADAGRSISQRLGRYVADAGWTRRRGTNLEYFYERPPKPQRARAEGGGDGDIPF